MDEISSNGIALLSQEKEKNKHADAILKLAEELGVPVDDVKKTYEESLAHFKDASIKDYVPIFVSRFVRERLRDLNQAN